MTIHNNSSELVDLQQQSKNSSIMNPSIDGDNSEVYVTMYIHLNVLMKCTVIEQLLQIL